MVHSSGAGRATLAAAAWIVLVAVFLFGLGVALTLGFGYDSHAYWLAAHDMDHLYDKPPLAKDAYLYSPAFVQLIWPWAQLPWPVFAVTWAALIAAVFYWLLRGLPPRWFVPAMLACVPEVLTGNVYAFMALAIVLGISRGWPWTFPVLTKVSPGIVGFAFLALRGSLRRLGEAVIATGAVIGASMLLNFDAWSSWARFLSENRSSGAPGAIIPVPVRLVGFVAAAVLTYMAARRRAYWALPVAAILVSPTLGPNTLTLLAAIPRLVRASDHERETAA